MRSRGCARAGAGRRSDPRRRGRPDRAPRPLVPDGNSPSPSASSPGPSSGPVRRRPPSASADRARQVARPEESRSRTSTESKPGAGRRRSGTRACANGPAASRSSHVPFREAVLAAIWSGGSIATPSSRERPADDEQQGRVAVFPTTLQAARRAAAGVVVVHQRQPPAQVVQADAVHLRQPPRRALRSRSGRSAEMLATRSSSARLRTSTQLLGRTHRAAAGWPASATSRRSPSPGRSARPCAPRRGRRRFRRRPDRRCTSRGRVTSAIRTDRPGSSAGAARPAGSSACVDAVEGRDVLRGDFGAARRNALALVRRSRSRRDPGVQSLIVSGAEVGCLRSGRRSPRPERRGGCCATLASSARQQEVVTALVPGLVRLRAEHVADRVDAQVMWWPRKMRTSRPRPSPRTRARACRRRRSRRRTGSQGQQDPEEVEAVDLRSTGSASRSREAARLGHPPCWKNQPIWACQDPDAAPPA